MHPFIETQKEWMKNVPPFRAGDTLRVNVRVREGDKERLQAFEGIMIARNNTGVSETITIRKISFGHGVERIFHAGRAKLLTYWWFAWAVERAVEVRNWIHRTGKRMIRRLRAIVRLHA